MPIRSSGPASERDRDRARSSRTRSPRSRRSALAPVGVDAVGDRDAGRARRCAGCVAERSPGPRRAPRACASSSSTATWLTDRNRSTTSSTVITCSWWNVASCSGPKNGVSVNAASRHSSCCAPRRLLLDAVHDRPQRVDVGRGSITRVPHEPEPAVAAEHAGRLFERGRRVEPVERLRDGDGVEARGPKRQALGRARQRPRNARAGAVEHLPHAVDGLGRQELRAEGLEQARELPGAGREIEHPCVRGRCRDAPRTTRHIPAGSSAGPARRLRPRGRTRCRQRDERPWRHDDSCPGRVGGSSPRLDRVPSGP